MSTRATRLTLVEFLEQREKAASFTDDLYELNDYRDQLVFVYGTLRVGHSRNEVLQDMCTFQTYGFTERTNLVMKYARNVGFPSVFLGGDVSVNLGRVFGEIWKVPTDYMIYLDQLEGNGALFQRIPVDIAVSGAPDPKTNKPYVIPECWMYIGTKTLKEKVEFTDLVPDYSSQYGRYYGYKKMLLTPFGRITAE